MKIKMVVIIKGIIGEVLIGVIYLKLYVILGWLII